jgi:hypothetical protein
LQNKIIFNTKFFAKNKNFKNEDNVSVDKLQEKNMKKKNIASFKSLKKGVGSGVVRLQGFGSGSNSQRYGSGDPDPHQMS